MRNVYLVDDDPEVLRSAAMLLRGEDFDVRCYASAEGFLDAAAALSPGCVVTDVRMPGMNGVELVGAIKSRAMPFEAVVISGHGDVPMAVEAMRAGAAHFLEKPYRDSEFLSVIGTALEAPAALGGAPDPARQAAARARVAQLTSRELDVLAGVALGGTSKSIARDLNISPRTVEVHRAKLMVKTDARSTADMVRLALEAGLPGAGTQLHPVSAER